MVKEEAKSYNDGMSEITTGEHRGREVRGSGETSNVTFLRDWNFWQGSSLLAQGRVFLSNSDVQEMNSMPLSHFVSVYPPPSPYPQVHSLVGL